MTHLLTWLATGLVAGWIVRTVARSRRDFGVLGDIVIGSLGAMIGGWLFRSLGVTAPDGVAGQVIAALFGAGALLAAFRGLRRLWVVSPLGSYTPQIPTPTDLYGQFERLSALERQVFGAILGRQPVARDPNTAFDTERTFGERVADRVAAFGGSWTFIGLFFIVMIAWMTLNQEIQGPFDPYPFILLNLVLSCLAALQAPVIMMSQNRMAAKDRTDARSDYEVNLRAEMEIMALHGKLDAARDQEWGALARLVSAQNERLARLEEILRAGQDASKR